MNIGIIGAGNIGATAAGLFAEADHEVVISNSRGPETLSDVAQGIGGRVSAVTIEEAADFGEVVLEAIPFGRYEELPVDRLEGKSIVSDLIEQIGFVPVDTGTLNERKQEPDAPVYNTLMTPDRAREMLASY